MKKPWSTKKLIALNAPFMGLIVILMIAIIILSVIFSNSISVYLYGVGSSISAETLAAGSELCEDIGREGTVLLKNSEHTDGKKTLPLSEDEAKKVNVFGWAAYDWMTSTFGSGFSNTELEKLKLFPALTRAGIKYNTTLYNMYKDFYTGSIGTQWGKNDWNEYRGDVAVGTTQKFILHEPGASFYTQSVINEAREFSSVALVVIGRTGGEAADLRMYQEKQVQKNGGGTTRDNDRTYLQISTEEEEMIAAAKQACDKVIVILNVSNTMEVGFIDDEGIDAALLVGLTGMSGVNGVIDILRGKDADGNPVSPSGRTVDTYAYSIASAPTFVNAGYGGAVKYNNASNSAYTKGYYDAFIDYHEGIYVGYRYYETAAAEGYIDYDATVQYPFGYGLSYTEFEYTIESVTVNGAEKNFSNAIALGKNDKIEITVDVKNVGNTAGKEVVQLYYTAPYTRGGIEKSHVVLGDFVKTPIIEKGDNKQVKLNITAQGMSSYDCYDLNKNGHTGYELDGGKYILRLMRNSHDAAPMADQAKSTIEFIVSDESYTYDVDEQTGNPVENRFTGENTIDGYPIDGSKEETPVKYMTRSDFEGTFPKAKQTRSYTTAANTVARATAPTAEQLAKTGYDNVAAPVTGNYQGFDLEDMLDTEGYGDELWGILVKEIPKSELFENIRNGFFNTVAMDSIGKERYIDLDGPLGLNTRVMSTVSCSFISYPSETLVAQTFNTDLAYALGLSVGQEAKDSNSGIRGWYGPAANIHRNPYGGRNGENYSEDALLSGRFAAETVRGAKNKGLYCYTKHFAANDSESLREGLFTFMTEQTLREIYLKPFEFTVKQGGGNAMMTSMNRVGAVWTGASRALCTDILRNEWDFNGTLVTDWVDTGKGDYMPVYKGIWAGNDLWLNNADAQRLFSDSDYNTNNVFVTLAQKVAHDTLYTLIDTSQTSAAYDPTGDMGLGSGAEYNYTWVWYIVLVELVFAAGLGVMTFFFIKKLLRNKKAVAGEADEAPSAAEEDAEVNKQAQTPSDATEIAKRPTDDEWGQRD